MTGIKEGLALVGRGIISIVVIYVVANGLMLNSKLAENPIAPWLGGLFAGLVCMGMLYVIGKK